ncbi:MAG: hypothetical protein WAM76_14735 [Pseudolabrys sp.]
MARTIKALPILALVFDLLFGLFADASANEFGGYECTDDCSGHAAGYRWAEAHNITDESNCSLNGNATSFYEGCLVYVDDPYRGADEDDEGNPL